MRHDVFGQCLSTASDAAVAAFDHALNGYLKNRADLPQRMEALLAADPEFGLAHCLRGYLMMLGFKQALVPAAIAAEAAARRLSATATPRERAHVDALAAWIAGNHDGALARWEDILRAHPRDVIAFRLAHFLYFWLGRAQEMLVSVERVLPAWSIADGPAYGAVLACRCFALEEAGHLVAAEPPGRQAIELDPGDLWAAHAVAHVLEMQGRRAEGLLWLGGLAPNWQGGNNLQHHLWWHAALYRLEQGDTTAVLDLYDTRFRDLAGPLTLAQPDVYIDVQNAAAMLFRLERLGVDVGGRWDEIADKAEARIGDCLSAFTLPHWMMALAATGRTVAAARMVEAMRAFAAGGGTMAPIVRDNALPICQAVIAHRAGRYGEAVALMRPALGGMHRLGGSHAQQDVLEQLFADAALKAGLDDDLRLIVERVAGRRHLPPARSIGWREAAARLAG
jgi:tetratricopeptide (TPR) repeat protein